MKLKPYFQEKLPGNRFSGAGLLKVFLRLLLSWCCLITTPVVAASENVFIEPLFTHGETDSEDFALVDKLRYLITNATAGSDIRFSLFWFRYPGLDEPIIQDLRNAAARGVNVQLMIDLPETAKVEERNLSSGFQGKVAQLMSEAARTGNSDSWLKRHALHEAGVKDHNKIFLFSESAGKRHWIVTTSENLTLPSRAKYQAGLVIRHQGLYNDLERYWQSILDGSHQDFWQARHGNMMAYFYPQTSGPDHIYAWLDQFSMESSQARQGRVVVSMPRWGIGRFPLAHKLVDMARAGYRVQVLTRANARIVNQEILAMLALEPSLELEAVDVDALNIHSKYLLVEGIRQESGQFGHHLLVGSQNFTGMALRNNYELMIEVQDQQLVNAFHKNYRSLLERVEVLRQEEQ
jgi:phosphatidylserine/phosphatidylglycerophosphate/cardiolipin synthase-like enzyme